MNPKPFSALNHLTVPVAMCCYFLCNPYFWSCSNGRQMRRMFSAISNLWAARGPCNSWSHHLSLLHRLMTALTASINRVFGDCFSVGCPKSALTGGG
jgi:hypothetical protein